MNQSNKNNFLFLFGLIDWAELIDWWFAARFSFIHFIHSAAAMIGYRFSSQHNHSFNSSCNQSIYFSLLKNGFVWFMDCFLFISLATLEEKRELIVDELSHKLITNNPEIKKIYLFMEGAALQSSISSSSLQRRKELLNEIDGAGSHSVLQSSITFSFIQIKKV